MNWYWVWIPFVTLFYVGYAWFSKQNNASQDIKWILLLYLYGGLIQPWVFVSRISKNLLLDSFVYDFVIMTSYIAALIVFDGTRLTAQQIVGIFLCIIGIMLVR